MEANYESAIRQRDQARQELELVRARKEQGQEEIVIDDQSYFERMVQEANDPSQPERHEPEEEGTEEEQVPDELEERSETHSEEEEEVKRQEERHKRNLKRKIERCKTWKAELEVAIARIPDRKLEEKSWGMPRMKCIFCWQWDSHYSQACMRYPTATERRQIIRALNRCYRCLEECQCRGYCAFERKACYYCTKALGAIYCPSLELDVPHHTALCLLIDYKERDRTEVQELNGQIERYEEELRAIQP
ncbi:hypothetical protein Q1695_012142 [Nippostrongylus brasiliensis]|nr:hypothetical protein Q1695_012142 [Nippostrongylus brasiliensis]